MLEFEGPGFVAHLAQLIGAPGGNLFQGVLRGLAIRAIERQNIVSVSGTIPVVERHNVPPVVGYEGLQWRDFIAQGRFPKQSPIVLVGDE